MLSGKKMGILVEGILASFSLEELIIGLQKACSVTLTIEPMMDPDNLAVRLEFSSVKRFEEFKESLSNGDVKVADKPLQIYSESEIDTDEETEEIKIEQALEDDFVTVDQFHADEHKSTQTCGKMYRDTECQTGEPVEDITPSKITPVLTERGIQATPTLANVQINTSPMAYNCKSTQFDNDLRDVEVQTIIQPSLMPSRKRTREENNLFCSKKQRTNASDNLHEVEVQTELCLLPGPNEVQALKRSGGKYIFRQPTSSKKQRTNANEVVHCRVCNVTLHADSVKSHTSGKSHITKSTRWFGEESDMIIKYNDNDIEHKCAFCSCGFNNAEQALMHYKGARHSQQVQQLKLKPGMLAIDQQIKKFVQEQKQRQTIHPLLEAYKFFE